MTEQAPSQSQHVAPEAVKPGDDTNAINDVSLGGVKAESSGDDRDGDSKILTPETSDKSDQALATSADKTDANEAKEKKTADEDENSDDDQTSSSDSVATGMEIDTKQLYRKSRYDSWIEWSPENDLDADDAAEHKRYALIVRRERDPEGAGLIFHSITVQSPLIREFLTKVFEGYRSVFTGLKNLVFLPPFHEFFYRWDRFQKFLSETEDGVALQHIDLLHKVIAPQIQAHLDVRNDLLANGLVTFEYLWAIFEPDTEVFQPSDTGDRLYISRDCFYRISRGFKSFVLNCEYIDYNGTTIGWASQELEIGEFKGHMQITDLDPKPSSFLPNLQETKQALTERGKVFEALKGMHYKTYSGPYLPRMPDSFFKSRRRNIDKGRVVIDAHLYHEQDPDGTPYLRSLGAEAEQEKKSGSDDLYYSDDDYDTEKKASEVKANSRDSTSLLEEEYCLCTPLVHGYCLPQKLWGTFEVVRVAEIEWDIQAFNKLVLPFDYKELILAFSESQFSHKDGFDDIISGKGQGIIMLLSGEPGVGKTLTAEAVSEEMKTPLYAMSAGELGNDAYEVESNLQKVLEISAKWDAVLLIDECDVFLEQRTISDLQRNKLVAVFLRLLEYYKGVMFLTTNRVSTFDAAFQSRIHLTINYPPLDESSRLVIWQTFAGDASSNSSITDKDLAKLARLDLNGREIKNIIKTARLLANRRSSPLALDHIETVLRIKKESAAAILRQDFH